MRVVCTKVPVTHGVACGKRDDSGRAGNGETGKFTSGTITNANSMTVAQSTADSDLRIYSPGLRKHRPIQSSKSSMAKTRPALSENCRATPSQHNRGYEKTSSRLPRHMRVEVESDVTVTAKTVADLCALPTWPEGLVLDIHVDLNPQLSVVWVERAS